MFIFRTLFIVIICLLGLAFLFNHFKFSDFTKKINRLNGQIEKLKKEKKSELFDQNSFSKLPPTVKKYFEYSLPKKGEYIQLALLKHSGTLKKNYTDQQWMKFEASQKIVPRSDTFVWEANVKTSLGFSIKVIDSYIEHIGSGQVWLSFLNLGSDENNTPMNLGSLTRFLAESVWTPTSLIPNDNISWTEIAENKALLTVNLNKHSVTLEIVFNSVGQIESIYSPSRHRKVGKNYVKTPWKISLRN